MQEFLEFVGNNLLWVSLWFALLILLVWNVFGSILQGIIQIEPMEATRLINHEHAVLIDMRSAEDFANGHILNAVNMSETELIEKKAEMDKMRKKPVIVYCQSGMNSPRMVKLLKTNGFPAVFGLKGGLAAWQKAGMPVSRSAGQSKQVVAS